MTIFRGKGIILGHFYSSTGEPVYKVKKAGKTEEMRDTTLRDARKLGLVPGVTTITNLPSSFFLEEWKQRQVVMACQEWPYTQDVDYLDWEKQVLELAKKNSSRFATRGNEIHDAMEAAFRGESVKNKDIDIVEAAQCFIYDYFGKNIDWVPEQSFAYDGYGGKCDLHSKSIIIDFKTKDWVHDKDVKTYDSHVMQLAAYRHGLGIPTAECYNLFIHVNEPGKLYLKHWNDEELERGWKMFQHLKAFWYLQTGLSL